MGRLGHQDSSPPAFVQLLDAGGDIDAVTVNRIGQSPRSTHRSANDQTGIYPVASPGGWQLIGRTPVRLFRPETDRPFIYQTGDRIRFVPITPSQYEEAAAERGL